MRLQSRPVVNLSFALDYAVGGLNTLPYHVTNLAIHLLAGLALFGVVRRTLLLPRLRDRFGRASAALALAVALLWAVHPLQTESVTYITQRYESMMGLFYLVAVYGVIRCGDSTHPYCWGAVTVAATLLVAGLQGSGRLAADHDSPGRSGVAERVVRRNLASAMGDVPRVAGRLGRVCPAATPRGSAPWAGYALPLSWFEYACSQPGVILHYLRLVFWPHPLVLDYGWPPARTVGEILPGAMVVAGLLAATGYAFWRWPAWGLLGAWFFLILAPTSSVMPLADLAFEHRMYLPLAAVAAAVVLGVYAVSEALALSARRRAMVLGCLLGGVGLALAILTWQRNNDYRDDFLLWQDVVARRPNNPRAHNNLGIRAWPTADRSTRRSPITGRPWKSSPTTLDAHNNLGIALAGRGQVDEAIAHYRKALEIKPDYAEAHNNLGIALAGRGQGRRGYCPLPEGPGNQARLRRGPQQPRQRLGRPRTVRRGHCPLPEGPGNQARLRRGPQQPRQRLGWPRTVDEAIAHYRRRPLEIKPDYADAQHNLGSPWPAAEKSTEAMAHYRKALEIEPEFAEAHNNLGTALAGAGRSRMSSELLQQAGKQTRIWPKAHYNLGTVLAGRGQVR